MLIMIIVLLLLNIIFFYKYNETLNSIDNTYTFCDSVTILTFEHRKRYKELNGIYYFGRHKCADCQVFEKVLKNIIYTKKFKVPITYVNVEHIRNIDWKKWSDFKKENNFDVTPAIIFYKNSLVVDSYSSEFITKESFDNWLVKNNLILN